MVLQKFGVHQGCVGARRPRRGSEDIAKATSRSPNEGMRDAGAADWHQDFCDTTLGLNSDESSDKFRASPGSAQGDGFFINAGFSGQTEFLAALVHVAFASMPFRGNAFLIEDPELAQGR